MKFAVKIMSVAAFIAAIVTLAGAPASAAEGIVSIPQGEVPVEAPKEVFNKAEVSVECGLALVKNLHSQRIMAGVKGAEHFIFVQPGETGVVQLQPQDTVVAVVAEGYLGHDYVVNPANRCAEIKGGPATDSPMDTDAENRRVEHVATPQASTTTTTAPASKPSSSTTVAKKTEVGTAVSIAKPSPSSTVVVATEEGVSQDTTATLSTSTTVAPAQSQADIQQASSGRASLQAGNLWWQLAGGVLLLAVLAGGIWRLYRQIKR